MCCCGLSPPNLKEMAYISQSMDDQVPFPAGFLLLANEVIV